MIAKDTPELSLETYPDICPNCPAARGLISLCERFEEKPVCITEKEAYREHTVEELGKLNVAAKSEGCVEKMKVLPDIDAEVPPIGLDYCGFVKQCLSYAAYKEQPNSI